MPTPAEMAAENYVVPEPDEFELSLDRMDAACTRLEQGFDRMARGLEHLRQAAIRCRTPLEIEEACERVLILKAFGVSNQGELPL